MIKKPVTQERTKVLYAMSKKEGLFLAEEIRKAYIPINNKVNKQQKKYKRIFSSFCLVGGFITNHDMQKLWRRYHSKTVARLGCTFGWICKMSLFFRSRKIT